MPLNSFLSPHVSGFVLPRLFFSHRRTFWLCVCLGDPGLVLCAWLNQKQHLLLSPPCTSPMNQRTINLQLRHRPQAAARHGAWDSSRPGWLRPAKLTVRCCKVMMLTKASVKHWAFYMSSLSWRSELARIKAHLWGCESKWSKQQFTHWALINDSSSLINLHSQVFAYDD